jgi:hypothetical protein
LAIWINIENLKRDLTVFAMDVNVLGHFVKKFAQGDDIQNI